MKRFKSIQPAIAHPVVRVSVPASVAYDFDSLTKVTQKILGQLGCGGCHSGRWIQYEIEDRFVVNEQLEVNPIFNGIRINEQVY